MVSIIAIHGVAGSKSWFQWQRLTGKLAKKLYNYALNFPILAILGGVKAL